MPTLAANGIRIEYEIAGPDEAPVVLLVMGLAGNLKAWPDPLFFGLAEQGFRVIRYDHRDVGHSTHLIELGLPDIQAMAAKRMKGEPVTPPYRLEDMAADAVALLDGLQVEKAHVAGMSMGGMIGQILALDHPEKVKSLMSIMSTTARPGLPPSRPEAMAALLTPPASLERADRVAHSVNFFRIVAGSGFGAPDEELRRISERIVDYAPADPAGVARQTAAVIAAAPRNERLRSVDLPAFVLHGDDDPLLPLPHGEDTAASIPNARLRVVPGWGHTVAGPATPLVMDAIAGWVMEAERR